MPKFPLLFFSVVVAALTIFFIGATEALIQQQEQRRAWIMKCYETKPITDCEILWDLNK